MKPLMGIKNNSLMKVEKNKIVFILVIAAVVLFMGSYYVIAFDDKDENEVNKNQIPVPELDEEQNQYETKMEALDAIKEEREKTAPSLYPEHMIDEKGYFNPDYMEFEKQRIIDSVYQSDQNDLEKRMYRDITINDNEKEPTIEKENDTNSKITHEEQVIVSKQLSLDHQLFFASNPEGIKGIKSGKTDAQIYVCVDGNQTVKQDYRLRMRLIKDAVINGKSYQKNTPLYGFVSFKPNRTLLTITSIGDDRVNLKAYDKDDGAEGIYIVNSFRGEATQEVIDDVVDDINVAGVPQVSGIKKIFQRNNRQVKVTILDNYLLILKPKQ